MRSFLSVGKRPKAGFFSVSILLLASCHGDLISQAERALDDVQKELVTGPATPPGQSVGPKALLSFAKVGGPDFLQARLDQAATRLKLDSRKSRRLPRFYVSSRRQVTLGGSAADFTARDTSISVDWDILQALLFTDTVGLQLAEEFLPVQARVAELEATRRLFSAYFEYEAADIENRALQDQIALSKCNLEEARIGLSLGEVSRSRLDALEARVAQLQRQAHMADQDLDAKRREVFFRAGLKDTATISTGANPARIMPAPPTRMSADLCYAHSGSGLRDQLLLAGASSALRLARLERYGSFDIQLPTAVSPSSGLNIDLVLSILVPLIDQNDAARRVQNAREALLSLILSVENSRREYGAQFSTALLAQSRAETALSEAQNMLEELDTTVPTSCMEKHKTAEARRQVDRAALIKRRTETTLSLICAPIAGPEMKNTQAVAAALEVAHSDYSQHNEGNQNSHDVIDP